MTSFIVKSAIPPTIQGNIFMNTTNTKLIKAEKINGVSITDNALGYKGYADVATTSNIILSGIQTIDGVALSIDNIVLVKDQTDPIENGIYDVKENTWTRNINMIVGQNAAGNSIYVKSGTTNQNLLFVCTNGYNNSIIGKNDLEFSSVSTKKEDPLTLLGLTVTGNSSLGTTASSTTNIGTTPTSTVIISSGGGTTRIGPQEGSYVEIGTGENSYINIGSSQGSFVDIGITSTSNVAIGGDGAFVTIASGGTSQSNIIFGNSVSKIGFYGNATVTRPNTSIVPSVIGGGGGTPIDDNTTFDGYTIAQIVKSLRNLGIIL